MTLCNHLRRHNSIPQIEEFLYLQEICVNGLSLAFRYECSPTHSMTWVRGEIDSLFGESKFSFLR